MADRSAPNADPVVDELRRKARRRLIGAVVLALAAAIVLPLLLEKEPRPLGDDVSVQIPPVDEGRFVNRLTGKAAEGKGARKADDTAAKDAPGRSDAGSEARAITAPPAKSLADAEQRVLAPAAPARSAAGAEERSAPAAQPNALPKPAPGPAANADERPAATPPPGAEPPSVAKAGDRPAAVPPARPEPAPAAAEPGPATAAEPAAAKAGGFVVQLAAFTDDKGANALANRLKKAGYAAFVEPVETATRGKLWRVRVGGYGSRGDAAAARDKLKGEGYDGMVVPAS